jgi:hypothetical protein
MAGASGTLKGEHSASFCSNEEEHSIGEATGDGGRARIMLVMCIIESVASDIARLRRNQLDRVIVNSSAAAKCDRLSQRTERERINEKEKDIRIVNSRPGGE